MLFNGELTGANLKIAIVISRFNDYITNRLLEGALKGFKEHNVLDENIDIAWVPGAIEIPLIAQKMAQTKKYDSILTLGCVIRGETTHYDYVCNEVAKGTSHVALTYNIPVLFGVITTENDDQAYKRSDINADNKGYDCAIGAIEMANLVKLIK